MAQEIEHNGVDELQLAGTLTVRLVGELHGAARALAASGRDVIVRCEAVEHADASVLQVLVALARALGAGGRRLTVVGAPAELIGWARLAGLERGELGAAEGEENL